MRVSSNWLKEFVGSHDTRMIADWLESVGVEVEQIIKTPKLDKKIVVAEVLKVESHPNADRLKVAQLSLGKTKTSVVCGGPNLAVGQMVALVQPGVVLPDGAKIEQASIRGVESNGMIASAFELGLGDDQAGIMVLDKSAKHGSPVADIWPADDIIDLKTAANRPDLLSVLGLAREAAAAGDAKLKYHEAALTVKSGRAPKVKVEKSTKTRRYMALELEADPTAPTPEWMQQRLTASGVRPISIIVDITNYVMLELGQPLHAFDASKVKLPITVRGAKSGEKLSTLDGISRKLTTDDVVIADSNGAIALAGVMGGAGSEISEKTKRIMLESASFDGASIRRTAIRHGCRSESSARFERTLPVQLAPIAMARAVELLSKHAKAKVVGAVADELTIWPWVQRIGVRATKVEQMLGFRLSREEMVKLLQRFQIEAEPFDIVNEAKKHVGKPYKWGAKFRTDGTDAFDCGYFTDYLYSLIGVWVGHTAPQQFNFGRPVHTGELKPGDLVFRDGPWIKLKREDRQGVSHLAMVVDEKHIIHAADIERSEDGEWVDRKKKTVTVEPIEAVVNDPQYLGARRMVENLDDFVSVPEVPWWRPDLKTEEDLVEEIVRVAGFDKVPAKLPAWQPAQAEFDRFYPKLWKLQDALKSVGLLEVMTYSFVAAEDLEKCGLSPRKHLKLQNPRSVEQAYLRSSILQSLISAAAKNQSSSKEFGLFEVSKVYIPKSKGELPEEPRRLAVIVKGESPYLKVKAALDAVAAEFGLDFHLQAKANERLHPAMSASVSLDGKNIGLVGEVHPDILAKYKLKSRAAVLEIELEPVMLANKPVIYEPVSKYPSVWRDLAVVVAQKVTWQDIKSTLSNVEAKVSYLSEFTGQGIAEGKKSLAMRIEMSDAAKTLTDKEADDHLQRIFSVLKRKFNAELRS